MARFRTVLMLLGLVAASSLAQAQAGEPKKAPPASPSKKSEKAAKEQVRELVAKLSSKDQAKVLAALQEMRAFGADVSGAAPAAEQLLRRGLPLELAKECIAALGAVGQQSSSPVIRPYLLHRDPVLRRAAANSLAKTRGPAAKEGLRRALSDSDAGVRGVAASGLGALGATEHLSELFTALDHGVAEAASAIGMLCAPEQCERFASKAGQLPIDILLSGFDQILFRKPSEMPDEEKISIVGRAREMGTAETHRFLKDVQARWPSDWSKQVKQAIDLAVSATQTSPGGARE